MPRKKPNKVRERTAIMAASNRREAHRRTRPPYGVMTWGGTVEIVFLHTTESIRQDPTTGGRPGSEIVVEPVVTLAGTCVFSPFARISSAAREQFPLVMVHQFCVIG